MISKSVVDYPTLNLTRGRANVRKWFGGKACIGILEFGDEVERWGWRLGDCAMETDWDSGHPSKRDVLIAAQKGFEKLLQKPMTLGHAIDLMLKELFALSAS